MCERKSTVEQQQTGKLPLSENSHWIVYGEARRLAFRWDHRVVDSVHILYALTDDPGSLSIFLKYDIKRNDILNFVESVCRRYPPFSDKQPDKNGVKLTDESELLLSEADKAARDDNACEVTPYHLLIGFVKSYLRSGRKITISDYLVNPFWLAEAARVEYKKGEILKQLEEWKEVLNDQRVARGEVVEYSKINITADAIIELQKALEDRAFGYAHLRRVIREGESQSARSV